ncbi:Bro-N domain-containing protein [Scrofimicrobium sp. R131]|uniref:BRO family protein n=1 Tax=Scrofimicrobium appendicitidis TaxID=3079930 RepID=A0AAU7V958_9ACTO
MSATTVLTDGGRRLFCGKDAATTFDFEDPTKVLEHCCRGVAEHHIIVDALGRTQDTRIITEVYLYQSVASSKLAVAERLESWVFDRASASIRRHGICAIAEPLKYANFLEEAIHTLRRVAGSSRCRKDYAQYCSVDLILRPGAKVVAAIGHDRVGTW